VKQGEDMSIATFKKAIQQDEYVTIGGGEPTLHPKFWEMIGLSLGHAEGIWLATNGSVTDTALALAHMAKRGIIGCALSQDPWHDPIDGKVIQAFTTGGPTYNTRENNVDGREIRNADTMPGPIQAGRCDWGSNENSCVCDDLIVKPSGIVKGCGCDDAPVFGNINDGYPDLPENYVVGECWKYNEECAT